MSDYIEPSRSPPCGSASRGHKPRYVKCLNFGQSILELDVADQLGCFVKSNRALVTVQSVARIPCTKKKDYVRKWIETHEDDVPDLNDDLLQLSPVINKSTTITHKKSPVLGNSGKRYRKRTCINRHAAVGSVGDTECQEQNAQYSASCTVQQDDGGKEENQSNLEYVRKIQCTPPSTEAIAGESPVGPVTHLYPFKRRRRRLWFGTEDYVSSKRLKLHDDKASNSHIIERDNNQLNNNYDTSSEASVDENKLEEDSDSNAMTVYQIEAEESPEKSDIRLKLSSKGSLSQNNNKILTIETDTSDEWKDEKCNKYSDANSSTNASNMSNYIEEVDSQDMLLATRKSELSAKSLFTSQSKPSQFIAISNETHSSEAEVLQNQSTQLSAKISLVPSREVSKSTQTPVISTISTPSKVSPSKTMYARLLDSGKKRPKAKKGSMVAKLQSLINTQVSGIRIWRHRMNYKKDAASARFISVLVRDCSKRFGNQFLKGILLEDRFNLLQNDVEIEDAESRNVQAPMGKASRRDLTIMLVCDIAGTLKMMSEVVINVHPPWEVLDKVNLTLEAMYINISRSREIPDLDPDTDNSRKREKRIVKEFNCPCIEEERELPFCAKNPSADKPDVMQRIFDF